MDKYEFTGRKLKVGNHVLNQIRALRVVGDVKKGSVGGWIESYGNLSQNGECWVYDDAKVYGSAEISEDAEIYGNAQVYGFAKVSGHASVCGNAEVFDSAKVYNYALVGDDARVFGNARVNGEQEVVGETEIGGNHMANWMRLTEGKFYDTQLIDDLERIADEYGVDFDKVLYWANCYMHGKEFYVDMENAEAADETQDVVDKREMGDLNEGYYNNNWMKRSYSSLSARYYDDACTASELLKLVEEWLKGVPEITDMNFTDTGKLEIVHDPMTKYTGHYHDDYELYTGSESLSFNVKGIPVKLVLNETYRGIDLKYGEPQKVISQVASMKGTVKFEFDKVMKKMQPWFKRHLSFDSYAKLYPEAAVEDENREEIELANREMAEVEPEMDVNPVQMTRRFWKIQKALKAGEANPEPQEKVDELKRFLNTTAAKEAFGKYYDYARNYIKKV